VAVHELLVMTEEVKRVVLEKGSSLDNDGGSYAGGNLLQDGATKVFKGLTTAEEVLRVTRQND
jgi:general secretion pathway protein E